MLDGSLSSSRVAVLAGAASAFATLLQSAAQGIAFTGAAVVIPVALGSGVLSAFLGYAVQAARMKEWQRLHELFISTHRSEVRQDVGAIRAEVARSSGELERRIEDVRRDQREDFKTLTRTMGTVRDAIRQVVLDQRAGAPDRRGGAPASDLPLRDLDDG